MCIWDIRRPKKPASSIDIGLGSRMICSTQFIGAELLALSNRQLVCPEVIMGAYDRHGLKWRNAGFNFFPKPVMDIIIPFILFITSIQLLGF